MAAGKHCFWRFALPTKRSLDTSHHSGAAGLERLLAALRQPARYAHAVERVELLQTHISCILLAEIMPTKSRSR